MTPEQEKKLNEVHAAIVGNEKMGHKGIVQRLDELEEYKEKYKMFKNWLAGCVFVGTPVLVIVWEWIQRRYLI